MAKPTIGQLLATKGKRQLTMTNAADYNTARAAEEAVIDIILARGITDEHQIGAVLDQVVAGAPKTVIVCNLPPTVAYVSDAEAIRSAMIARDHGADIIYSSGNSLRRFEAMAEVGINFGGHVGLVHIRSSRDGGLGARGKTLDGALRVYEETLAFQRAGAVMVEMECVAAEIAAEITKRVDILGFLEPRFPGLGKPYEGPLPRHARRYANLFEETKRGFAAFRADVERGNFPAPAEMIKADPSVVAAFRSQVGGATSG